MARVHEAGEVLALRCFAVEAPVRQDPHEVAIDRRRVTLFDDQGAVESSRQLLAVAEMRVVPVGAGVRKIEFVDELAAVRRDRRLRQSGHAVHGIRQPDAVPVHRGRRG